MTWSCTTRPRRSPEPSAEPRDMNAVDADKKMRAMRTMMKMRRMSGRISRKRGREGRWKRSKSGEGTLRRSMGRACRGRVGHSEIAEKWRRQSGRKAEKKKGSAGGRGGQLGRKASKKGKYGGGKGRRKQDWQRKVNASSKDGGVHMTKGRCGGGGKRWERGGRG